MIEITVTYTSGRKEMHFVKVTKAASNKAFQKKMEALQATPTIIDIKIKYPKKEGSL